MAGAIVIKQIKPSKVKDMMPAILNQMRKVEKEMLKDFQATTATWEHKVSFESALSTQFGGPSVHVITTDEIYNYVNNGTKPHLIFARNAKALSFKWGGKGSYRPKSRPRVIGSTPGGSTGPRVAFPYVQHPGQKEPREFDVTIQHKWEPRFKTLMEKGMADAAKASGHGIP